MPEKRTLQISTIHCIITMSVITALVTFFLIFQQSNKEYKESIHFAREDLKRLARLVSSNVLLNFTSIDQTLQRAVERQYFNLLFGKTLHADMEHNLSIWVNETPHIDAMFFTNADGIVEILFKKGSAEFQVKPGYKFSVKEHFNRHRKGVDVDMLISTSKVQKSSRIFVSRRIDNIDGSFGGLVVAVMDGSHITNFINSIEQDKKIQVAVLLEDNEYLVKGVDYHDDSNAFKARISEFKKYGNKKNEINIIEEYVNNEFTIFSFERIQNLPIYVSLAMNENDIFKSWQTKRNSNLVFAAILAVFASTIVFFTWLLDKKIKFVKNSEIKTLLASQTKSDFLSKMSHELRTPLNAIIGFSDMLSNGYFGKVSTDQVERLNDINMCGNHLLELISDILDFSKGEASKLKLKEELVDLSHLIARSLRVLEQKAILKNIDLINSTPREVNSIYGDRRKIKQILLNLLSNSIKFTPEGGSIIISTYLDREKNFIITVSDTGIGIDKKNIPKALEVFEQIHPDHDHGGTGLGLPLCKMFTEMHGGKLKLESRPGKGTKAFIILPSIRVRKPIFEEEMTFI